MAAEWYCICKDTRTRVAVQYSAVQYSVLSVAVCSHYLVLFSLQFDLHCLLF